MKRRRRLWLGAAALLLVAALVAVFEPTGMVRGLLRGEDFFRGRPTSYWREALRADGQAGTLSHVTVESFRGKWSSALPVLLACLKDPDRNVRWPAVNLLAHCSAPTPEILPPLRQALHDPDPEVRLQALLALGALGANARAAVPELAALYRDPQPQVAHFADRALWQIDVAAALKAGGWRPFGSKQRVFRAEFPAEPEQKEAPVMGQPGTRLHSFVAFHLATRYTVAVAEYAPEYLEGSTDEQRLDAARDLLLFGVGGKLVREEPVELQGRKGREVVVEVEGVGVTRTRLFWVGRRLYQVNVTYQERFLIPEAAEHFLNSFRFASP
jgi:hypothetical protein